MQRSDEFHWQLQKKIIISVVSVAKPKNIIDLAFTLYWRVLPCFMAISAWIYIVLTAMKR
jgi:hypothetical protein